MGDIIQLVGPHHVVQIFGVKLVGVNADNGKKLLFSLVFIAFVVLLAWMRVKSAREELVPTTAPPAAAQPKK